MESTNYADARVVGLPRALMWYRYGTLWKTFFETLDRTVVVSHKTDRGTFETGQKASVDECCLASKLFLGHVVELLPQVDAVFVPSLANCGFNRCYCTKYQSAPDLARNALWELSPRLMSLAVNESDKALPEREAYLGLAARLGATPKEAKRAWKLACRAQADHDSKLARAQEELVRAIDRTPTDSRPLAILVAAHPYVSHDDFVAGPVVDALNEAGATVLYADEYDHERAFKRSFDFSQSLPWLISRELMGAIVDLHEHVDGIVLMSAFPCGPDSMTDDAVSRRIKGKPVLTLTVDAQSGTAGLETRVESFVDILTYQRKGGYLHE